MNKPERKHWTAQDHESKVEHFYQAGIGHDQNWHGGFRNFGWWDGEIRAYLPAAERLVMEMNQRLHLGPESHLLDVGCGGAPQDVLLHQMTGATIDGVDATWAQVQEGSRRTAAAGIADKVRIHHGSATRLDFPDQTFTHVLSLEAAQHFNTREAFFRDAYRLLKPGGILATADFIVLVPTDTTWERFVVRCAQRLWNVPDENVQDEARYRASLERSGYTDITFEHVGRYTIPGYFKDQNTPETIAAHVAYKGRLWRAKMFWCNYFMNKAFEKGLLEYVIVRAVRR